MLDLYLLGQNSLHLTFKPYLGSETYSRIYEKPLNILVVVNTCKNITELDLCTMSHCKKQVKPLAINALLSNKCTKIN